MDYNDFNEGNNMNNQNHDDHNENENQNKNEADSEGYQGTGADGFTPNDPNPQPTAPNDANQYAQYGGNMQYKWNYDDYQKALSDQKQAPNEKKRRGMKPFLITVGSIFGVAVIGLAVVGVSTIAQMQAAKESIDGTSSNTKIVLNSQPAKSEAPVASGAAMSVEQVASKLTPAVVGIEVYNLQSVEPVAEGSGIVMSSDGYILTNAHVISGYQKLRVVMSNDKKFDAVKVVGQDTKTDLAVLKVQATGLTAATFGDSSQLKVGQSVIAIGNPGGLTLASSVTDGIVSGLNRSVNDTSSVPYVQTNAQINPGNSGGPLVNLYGQVIGINTSKIAVTGYEGIGFAIPINSAKPIIDSIINNGYVTGRVKLGISVYKLSNSQAKWYNYPAGLYVQSIEKNSDAYAKGLRTKDIITKINGVSLASDDADAVYNTFYNEETKYKAGDTVTLTVYRTDSGTTLTISAKLEEDKGDTEITDSNTEDNNGTNGNSGNGNSGNIEGSGNDGGNSPNDFWSQFFQQ